MKVPSSGSPSSSSSAKAPQSQTTGTESRFSKTLQSKAKEGKPRGTLPGTEPGDAAALSGMMPQQAPLTQARIDQTAGMSRPRAIEAIASEIQIHARGDVREVNIKFESKVLDGLEVRIRAEGGQIAIEFLASTARAHDTVSGGVDQLTSALHSKGLQVASIRVQSTARQSEAREGGRQDQRGGGGREGRRGRQQ